MYRPVQSDKIFLKVGTPTTQCLYLCLSFLYRVPGILLGLAILLVILLCIAILLRKIKKKLPKTPTPNVQIIQEEKVKTLKKKWNNEKYNPEMITIVNANLISICSIIFVAIPISVIKYSKIEMFDNDLFMQIQVDVLPHFASSIIIPAIFYRKNERLRKFTINYYSNLIS